VRVNILQLQIELAARHPSKVEQVVNQSRLQSHIAFDNFDVLREFPRKFVGVGGKISRRGQCRR